ncbi:MAG: DUF2141 domain-containing protein [Salibacteraceae bacterium]
MKTFITTLSIICASFYAQSQNTLTIKITNLKTNTGTVYVDLKNDKEKSVKKVKGTVVNQECTVEITEIPSGNYAVTYYHDENDNGQMDTGMFGKPEEGYGYSNDARGFMGPADFEDQIFEIKSNTQITLKTVQ